MNDMNQLITLPHSGTTTSRIGLGCGRIVGRSTLRESRAIVETALDLGVRHFDTAPSYGMGTSEEVLGEVLAGVEGVTITTKVGPPRGLYSARVNLARKLLKPGLDRLRSLKTIARRAYAPTLSTAFSRPRYDFCRDRVRREFDHSLRLLRRQSVDFFLAHEPHTDDLNPLLREVFTELVDEKRIRAWGVGVDARSLPLHQFGTVWQSGWPIDPSVYPLDKTYLFHGVLRHAPRDQHGNFKSKPGQLIRSALETFPTCIVLVSAANARRLRELLTQI
jgi:hypothetical protein